MPILFHMCGGGDAFSSVCFLDFTAAILRNIETISTSKTTNKFSLYTILQHSLSLAGINIYSSLLESIISKPLSDFVGKIAVIVSEDDFCFAFSLN